MRMLIRTGAGLALMAMCLAKSNDSGAVPAVDPPTEPAAPDIATIVPALTESPEYIALQKDRDKLADDLVRLGDFLHDRGFVLEVEGFPSQVVDIAIHHLGLKQGCVESLEASAAIIVNFQDQIERLGKHILAVAPEAVEGSAVDTAIKLIDDRKDLQLALETAQARARREVEEASAAPEDGDLSPATRLQHPVEEIETVLNAHFRTGGDAVIELHNATGRLKAAVRQVALIEQAEGNKAA